MNFPSKILLIGEHTVLHGSQSLSIPFDQYYGQWVFTDKSDDRLINLIDQLDSEIIDIDNFQSDCKNGLSFQSSIPVKYGLGSSGALTAALYRSYAFSQAKDIDSLQIELAKIESIFHGKSSGTDALVSYCNAAIHSADHKSYILKDNPLHNLAGFVYLFDSKVERSAKTFIQRFGQLVEEQKIDVDSQSKTCNHIIQDLLDVSHQVDVFPKIKQLSQLQFDQLTTFMPNHVRDLWEDGLHYDDYYFKLCGAGGGGYFLVFSRLPIKAIQEFSLIPLNSNT